MQNVIREIGNSYIKLGEDSHLGPFANWHHLEFCPCHSSGYAFGWHSNPKCAPTIKVAILYYTVNKTGKTVSRSRVCVDSISIFLFSLLTAKMSPYFHFVFCVHGFV